MDKYSIGTADQFEVIMIGGVERVEYDLKQVHDKGFARYNFLEEMHETDEIELGVNISTAIAEDIIETVDELGIEVCGFCVPDHMLATFIKEYPELTILRQRESFKSRWP